MISVPKNDDVEEFIIIWLLKILRLIMCKCIYCWWGVLIVRSGIPKNEDVLVLGNKDWSNMGDFTREFDLKDKYREPFLSLNNSLFFNRYFSSPELFSFWSPLLLPPALPPHLSKHVIFFLYSSPVRVTSIFFKLNQFSSLN